MLEGTGAASMSPPMRIVWFGESIVSDWNNPIATTARAVIRALGQDGHEVTFHEQRLNQPMMRAMRAHGSAMYRAFLDVYPDIRYRTYDRPVRRSDLIVWLARETAIADAVIVQDRAHAGIIAWLDQLTAPDLVRIYLRSSSARLDQEPQVDLVLSPSREENALFFGPAVLPALPAVHAKRSGSLTVYYDGAVDRYNSIPGHQKLDFVPEVLRTELYATLESVTIADDDSSPFDPGRAYLALAAGVESVGRLGPDGKETFVFRYDDARERARALVDAIHRLLMNRRTGIDLEHPGG